MSSSIDAYYPLGSAACCTPSLLLESGSAWELERCDCVQSGDINCGGIETHRFLTGFDRWRLVAYDGAIAAHPMPRSYGVRSAAIFVLIKESKSLGRMQNMRMV